MTRSLPHPLPSYGRLFYAPPKGAYKEALNRLMTLPPSARVSRPLIRKVRVSAWCPEGHPELWYPLGPLWRKYGPQFRHDFWNELRKGGTDEEKQVLICDFLPEAAQLLKLIPGQYDLAVLWVFAHCFGAKFHLTDEMAMVKIGTQVFTVEGKPESLTQVPMDYITLRSDEPLQVYKVLEAHPHQMVYLAYLGRWQRACKKLIPYHRIPCARLKGEGPKTKGKRLIAPDVVAKWLFATEQPRGAKVLRTLFNSIKYYDKDVTTYVSVNRAMGEGMKAKVLNRYTSYFNQQKGITC